MRTRQSRHSPPASACLPLLVPHAAAAAAACHGQFRLIHLPLIAAGVAAAVVVAFFVAVVVVVVVAVVVALIRRLANSQVEVQLSSQ